MGDAGKQTLNPIEGDVMNSKNKVVSHFSDVSGTDVRHVYSEDGSQMLGMIMKVGRGKYRVYRMDGKTRDKDSLTEAFRTVRRKN